MDPIKIIQKFYKTDSLAYELLVGHSELVAKKSLKLANNVPEMNLDIKFIKEAAMLHDIGVFLTNDPEIGCFGKKPYICHGYLGRELLEKEGLPKHALVCERHVGVGISAEQIEATHLPLPKRDMIPISNEEKLICLADKFFTKNKEFLAQEKSIKQIRKAQSQFGKDKVELLNKWLTKFGVINTLSQ